MSLNDSSCASAHNTPFPLKRSPPASFKRLLGGLRLRLHRPVGARRLNNHIDGGQQADQDDRIQYEEQRVARLEVEGGQHQYDEGTRDDSIEVVPIVSCVHKLEDEAA